MKAIYSYWDTGDGLKSATNWYSTEFMLSFMVVSVLNTKKNFSKIEMITDSKSKIWIEKLNLPFDKISTELDEIDGKYSKNSWAVGKIKAYSIQNEPFIHIDLDVILFNGLSKSLLSKDVIIQNYEYLKNDIWSKFYLPFVDIIESNCSDLPENFSEKYRAFNMGIYGCNNLEVNKIYCDTVFNFLDKYEKSLYEKLILDKICVVWEQYFCDLICSSHKLNVGVVLDVVTNEVNEGGYIHLMSNKSDKNVGESYINLVKSELPDYYRRIRNLLDN